MNIKQFLYSSFIIILISLTLLEITLYSGGQIYLKTRLNSGIKNTPKDSYKILAIGESTTAFGGEDSYPSLLQKRLQELSNKDFIVINEGIPAATTDDISNQIESYLNHYQPELVIFMTGINDHNIPSLIKKPFYEYLKTYKLLKALLSHDETSMAPKTTERKAEQVKYNTPHFLNFKKENLQKLPESHESLIKLIDKALVLKELSSFDLQTFIGTLMDSKEPEILRSSSLLEKMKELYKECIQREPLSYIQHEAYLAFLNNQYSEQLSSDDLYNKLLKETQKALDIKEDQASFHHYMAMSYTHFQNNESASYHFQRSIELSPTDFDFRWLFIKFLIDTNQIKKAVLESNKAIEARPFDVRFYNIRKEINKSIASGQKFQLEVMNIIANPNPYEIPKTLKNISTMIEMSLAKGARVALMQYPTRPLKPLREAFKGNTQDIFFIENRENFLPYLKKDKFNTLFWDQFAGDFGHATKKGQELIVDNIIKAFQEKGCVQDINLCLDH